jgi:hypothetical protein
MLLFTALCKFSLRKPEIVLQNNLENDICMIAACMLWTKERRSIRRGRMEEELSEVECPASSQPISHPEPFSTTHI